MPGDGEVIRRQDLPDKVATAAGPIPTRAGDSPASAAEGSATDFQSTQVGFKKQLILDAWHAAGEDYVRTADRLGVHVNSLHRLVKNLGLKDALGR